MRRAKCPLNSDVRVVLSYSSNRQMLADLRVIVKMIVTCPLSVDGEEVLFDWSSRRMTVALTVNEEMIVTVVEYARILAQVSD